MATDIFQFWSGIRLKDGAHPADHEVLSRVEHNFDLRCLPGCFMGPLRTAPVVLLYLSPGVSGRHGHREAKTRAGRARRRRVWRGEEPLPGPNVSEGAWRWWTSRTKLFGEDWLDLQTELAVLNIGAYSYRSKTFADAPLLAALPSSRASIDWAQHVLFPEAVAGKRVVVCLRAARFWGLQEGKRYGRALFVPPVTRGGYMKHHPMRAAVVRAAKAALARRRRRPRNRSAARRT